MFSLTSNSKPISYCEGHLSMKRDIFNFGILLLETLTGKTVFQLLRNKFYLDSQFKDKTRNSKVIKDK